MNTKQLTDEILAMLSTVRDDRQKLAQLHAFMLNKIYEAPKPEKIPVKYEKVVTEIADNLLAGFVCFLNPETLEIEPIPQALLDDPEEYEAITGETWESEERKYENWEKCIRVEPMDSHKSFKVMELYVEEMADRNIKNRLDAILNKRMPFANFKNFIENSDYRQQWYDFKQVKWEWYIWNILRNELPQLK